MEGRQRLFPSARLQLLRVSAIVGRGATPRPITAASLPRPHARRTSSLPSGRCARSGWARSSTPSFIRRCVCQLCV